MRIALIHGSYHGAWCWDRLGPELERFGHAISAVDLPTADPNAGAEAYAQAVIDGTDWTDPPVVVAHSTGGLTAPLVAARRPVQQLIFLAAFLPRPGMSGNAQRKAEPIDPPYTPTSAEWTDLGDGVWAVGPNTATELFFHDVPEDVRAWAIAQLRPQAYRLLDEVTPLVAWPDVASDYVVCRDDHAISAAWGRSAARERLGVEAAEIDGGHSPMLSRPAELAQLIDRLIAARG